MKTVKPMLAAAAFVLGTFGVSWGMRTLHAQPQSIQRKVLQRKDLSVPGRELVMAAVEIAPGASEGRHTHPGEVMAYIEEGTLQLEVEGHPNTTLKAGEVIFVEAGKVHQGVNVGKTPIKLVSFFVVDKNKPLTTQVK